MNSDQQYKIFALADIPFIGIIIIALLFFSYQFYLNIYSENLEKGEKSNGISIEVNNLAQRKKDGTISWQNLITDDLTFNNDLIRTGEDSSVRVKIQNQLILELDSYSLVLLNLSQEKKQSINFQYGSLLLEPQIINGNSETVLIEDADQDIAISGGKVRLEKDIKNKMHILAVEGTSTVSLKSGQSHELNENTQVIFNTDDNSFEVPLETLNLMPRYNPQHNQKFFTTDLVTQIKFIGEYNSNIKDIRELVLEISEQRNFIAANTFSLQVSNLNKFSRSINNLSNGSYFWRLKAIKKNGKNIASAWQKFRIIRKSPLQILSPQPFAKYKSNKKNQIINIAWKKAQKQQHYRLKIATDKDFNNNIYQWNTNYNFIRSELPPGEYFASLAYLVDMRSAVTYGEKIVSFSVIADDAPEFISIYKPENETVFHENANSDSPSNPLFFRWDNVAIGVKMELLVASDLQLKNIVIRKIVDKGFYYLTQEDLDNMKSGKYYWSIRGLDEDKKIVAIANTQSFYMRKSKNEKTSEANQATVVADSIVTKAKQKPKVKIVDSIDLNNIHKNIASGDVNIRDKSGNSALHLAAQTNRVTLTKYLLQEGIDVNLRNKLGDTALHVAIKNDFDVIVEVLMASGRKINKSIKNKAGKTALDIAKSNNNDYIINLLK